MLLIIDNRTSASARLHFSGIKALWICQLKPNAWWGLGSKSKRRRISYRWSHSRVNESRVDGLNLLLLPTEQSHHQLKNSTESPPPLSLPLSLAAQVQLETRNLDNSGLINIQTNWLFRLFLSSQWFLGRYQERNMEYHYLLLSLSLLTSTKFFVIEFIIHYSYYISLMTLLSFFFFFFSLWILSHFTLPLIFYYLTRSS